MKYDHESKFGPSEELHAMKVNAETTMKYFKNNLNEPVIFGELEPNQYFVYGEQEDKGKNEHREHIVITNIVKQFY